MKYNSCPITVTHHPHLNFFNIENNNISIGELVFVVSERFAPTPKTAILGGKSKSLIEIPIKKHIIWKIKDFDKRKKME